MSDRRDDASERIGAAIRAAAAQVGAPDELRARITQRRARSRRGSLVAGGAALAATAAVVVALVIALMPASPGAPSVADVAALGLRAPTRPAPEIDRDDPRFVDASVGGVRFPNYAYESAWRAGGERIDGLDRRSRTVTYARGSARVGYTIVDGPPLAAPAHARREDAAGTPVSVVRLGGALVVSWERSGHTCVLASRTTTLPQMLRFVAWDDET